MGVAGPLRVNGTYAQGDYYVPLATTEAALVASYHRGALLLSEAGGCSAVLLHEAPVTALVYALVTPVTCVAAAALAAAGVRRHVGAP